MTFCTFFTLFKIKPRFNIGDDFLCTSVWGKGEFAYIDIKLS
jgi:hypothetical protein